MKRTVIGFTLVLAFGALSRVALAEVYQIDHEVWGVYQKYVRGIGNGNKPGAFVITKDGRGAAYTWCEDIRCMAGPSYSQDALNYCEREYKTECVVFAVRDDIKVEYKIRSEPAATQSPLTAATSQPTTRIAVSKDVQTQIDAYLRNAQSAARFWALAIAKDGSTVTTASCASGGSYADGGDCEPTKGHPQELATKKAIKHCGGPDECILLYTGQKKSSDIEIVAQ